MTATHAQSVSGHVLQHIYVCVCVDFFIPVSLVEQLTTKQLIMQEITGFALHHLMERVETNVKSHFSIKF